MNKNNIRIEDLLVKGLSHILRRTLEVNNEDRLAIAQEYKEWINCASTYDFSQQEILVIDKITFDEHQ